VTVDNRGTSTAEDTAPAAAGQEPSRAEIRERAAAGPPAPLMLALHAVLLVIGLVLIGEGAAGPNVGQIVSGGVLILLAIAVGAGVVTVSPGDAQVLQLFGRYTGTIRGGGMYWVRPASKRTKISTRIRSHQTEVAKVNDADGNPIEIAAVVVWQVEDTAKAVFAVDDLTSFVALQAETTVRQIASQYAYDDHGNGLPSLRRSTEEVTARLAGKLAERVAPAGVKIIEARLIRLAYAQEIAHAMLRRQAAGAMIAARQKIVDGAVGMVEQALARLDADGLVELDPERKAAMVSNMLVVLCSDHPTQPVVNTGTLYQ
jgi:regulator of protease activity HflC (stomatin/prohibitin superfamily)